MFSPFALPPEPSAQAAAALIINKVHAYMRANPDSELHRLGKMFGVLVIEQDGAWQSADGMWQTAEGVSFIAAFSAQLDGQYLHEGFVPPVYEMKTPPIGTSKEESRRLQQLLFAEYNVLNGKGEQRNLLEIFQNEQPIFSPEEWFGKGQGDQGPRDKNPLPPSGAGECCAPKLLQYAFKHGLKPVALAEFWIGATPKNELRREGQFYAPCSGRCVPILRFMMQGLDLERTVKENDAEALCRQVEIIYEDESLVVVNKPAGLLSVPGKTEEFSLSAYLKALNSYHYLMPAHRLDQDTSGLIVLAKTEEVYKTLQAYFQRRDILKRYEALIKGQGAEGALLTEEGEIRLPLLPNPYDRPRQMVSLDHGKPAITRYKIRERRADGSFFVDFYPQTGRTHQLRVHAAHPDGLNAPIIGDRLYGNGSEESNRLMLHAAEIRFVHPVTKKEMHFCIPSRF